MINAKEIQTGENLTDVGNVAFNRKDNISYLKMESYKLTEAEEQQRLNFCFHVIESALNGTVILREIIDQALLIIQRAAK